MKGVGMALPLMARWLVGFVLAAVPMLVCSAVADAQSRRDQYGSPMDPADPGIADPGLLGVLPETGGALILYVAALLIIVGTAVMLVRNLRSL